MIKLVKKIKNNPIIVAFILVSLFSKGTGFLREVVIAAKLGASFEADALILVTTIPTVIFGGIAAAIGINAVPDYFKVKNKRIYMKEIFSLISYIGIFVGLIVFIFADQITYFFAGGMNKEQLEYISGLTRISSLSTIFIGLNSVGVNFLNAQGKSIVSSLLPIITNIIMIISILFYNVIGLSGVIWVIIFANILQFIIQNCILMKVGKITHRRNFLSYKGLDKHKTLLVIAFPTFLALSLDQILPIFERVFASYLEIGSLARLNYAHRLDGLLIGIIGGVITAIIYPKLAKNINDQEKLSSICQKFIWLASLLLLPIISILILNSRNIVMLVFQRGNFTAYDTEITSNIFMVFLFSTFFYIIRSFGIYILISFKKTKIPLLSSVISVFTFIVISSLFVKEFGIYALAIGGSSSVVISSMYIIIKCKKYVVWGFKKYKHILTMNILIISFLNILFLFINKQLNDFVNEYILVWCLINSLLYVIIFAGFIKIVAKILGLRKIGMNEKVVDPRG
ncbi:lipid II flippase MurJ [Peribacillus asahii]|uniref:lipid II flippase MurJ n=1 Tax=Peribacillus asahii TaxID=228899 RepID=UPI0038096690